jgi:two-component system, OmpR family, sensor histidine kinase BaeS
MRSLFFRVLLSSVAGLVIFLVFLAGFLFLGFERSLESWSDDKLTEIQTGIEKMLKSPEEAEEVSFPENISVFVYNVDQELVFSNRGEGRKRSFSDDGDVKRIVSDGDLVGYYHIGNVAFRNDYANQQFVSSMMQILWVGVLISCVLSVIYAFFFSRSLARPATTVAQGIRAIAEGNLEREIPEGGADELSSIAHAANDLRKQLKREQLLRVQWAQDIAHDLRTPVSALKAQFEGMSDGVLPLNIGRIEQNLVEIHRVEKLVSDLQELMQLENPELSPRFDVLPVDELLSDVASAFAFEAARSEAEISTAATDIVFSADGDLLQRAISNIVSNAVRHVEKGGSVELAALETETHTVISVHNTGEPIPENEIDRVFDRLFRGDHARHSPGTGLGLTIARQIVELHGGTIGIASSVADGTVVHLRFPR